MIHEITAMHEIAHTFGVGTDPLWNTLVKNGKFIGSHALLQFDEITRKHVDLNADKGHFWPYGLNQANEVKSERDLLYHCLMVAAIKRDIQELNIW